MARWQFFLLFLAFVCGPAAFDHPAFADEPASTGLPAAEIFLAASVVSENCVPDTDGCDAALADEDPWTFHFDFLSLKRNLRQAPLLTAGIGGASLVSASQFDTGYSPGFELELDRRIGDLILDVRYFQVETLNASLTRGGGVGDSLFDLSAATTSTESFSYGSDLYNFEFNVLKQVTPWLRPLAGFRYLRYQESCLVDFDFAGPNTLAGTLTQNDLYGVQIGCEADLLPASPRFQLEAVAKTGIYGSYSQSRALLFRPAGSTVLGNERSVATFVGEFGLNASLMLRRWLSLEAGYRVLFLDGIALAGEQFSTTSMVVPVTNMNQGDVILHGFNVGLVAAW
jgi:hypothetical protein